MAVQWPVRCGVRCDGRGGGRNGIRREVIPIYAGSKSCWKRLFEAAKQDLSHRGQCEQGYSVTCECAMLEHIRFIRQIVDFASWFADEMMRGMMSCLLLQYECRPGMMRTKVKVLLLEVHPPLLAEAGINDVSKPSAEDLKRAKLLQPHLVAFILMFHVCTSSKIISPFLLASKMQYGTSLGPGKHTSLSSFFHENMMNMHPDRSAAVRP